jgi:hypothetical protein
MDVLAAAATAIVGSISSAVGLGWWLKGQFQEVQDTSKALIKEHEDKDNLRHEDNLERFSAIKIELARIEGRPHHRG